MRYQATFIFTHTQRGTTTIEADSREAASEHAEELTADEIADWEGLQGEMYVDSIKPIGDATATPGEGRPMKLLTKELRQKLPPLHSTGNQKDPLVQVKFFTPWTNWTWYATEFDGEDLLFGLVEGFCTEWGYFSLAELEATRGPGGLRIERDLYFDPAPVSQVVPRRLSTE